LFFFRAPLKNIFTTRLQHLTLLLLLFPGRSVAQQGRSFNARANLVPVPKLVKDANGNAIYGLHQHIIEDDGVQQPVHVNEAAEAEPISLIIAVQCGRRAKQEFPRIRTLASMLDPILSQPGAETALLLFDSKLNLARDFTNNADSLKTT